MEISVAFNQSVKLKRFFFKKRHLLIYIILIGSFLLVSNFNAQSTTLYKGNFSNIDTSKSISINTKFTTKVTIQSSCDTYHTEPFTLTIKTASQTKNTTYTSYCYYDTSSDVNNPKINPIQQLKVNKVATDSYFLENLYLNHSYTLVITYNQTSSAPAQGLLFTVSIQEYTSSPTIVHEVDTISNFIIIPLLFFSLIYLIPIYFINMLHPTWHQSSKVPGAEISPVKGIDKIPYSFFVNYIFFHPFRIFVGLSAVMVVTVISPLIPKVIVPILLILSIPVLLLEYSLNPDVNKIRMNFSSMTLLFDTNKKITIQKEHFPKRELVLEFRKKFDSETGLSRWDLNYQLHMLLTDANEKKYTITLPNKYYFENGTYYNDITDFFTNQWFTQITVTKRASVAKADENKLVSRKIDEFLAKNSLEAKIIHQ